MKKLFILMNCQGVELMDYFNRVPEFQKDWQVTFFSSYEMSEVETLVSLLPQADCLVTQNIKSIDGMRYNELTPYLRKDAIAIKLEYWRSNAFWPLDIPHTWDGFWYLPKEFGDFSSMTFDEWTQMPIDKAKIVENFESEYDRFVAIDRLSDIKIAHLFADLYKSVPTLSDYNHPASHFFCHIANIILDMIGVKGRAKPMQNSGQNRFRWRLISDDVMNALDLKFDRDNIFFHRDRIDRRTFFEFSKFLSANFAGKPLTVHDVTPLFRTFSESHGLSYKDIDVLNMPAAEKVSSTVVNEVGGSEAIFDLHGYRPISDVRVATAPAHGLGHPTHAAPSPSIDLSIDGEDWVGFTPGSYTGYASTEDLPLARYVRVRKAQGDEAVEVLSPVLS